MGLISHHSGAGFSSFVVVVAVIPEDLLSLLECYLVGIFGVLSYFKCCLCI
jgi:hypothetical protein